MVLQPPQTRICLGSHSWRPAPAWRTERPRSHSSRKRCGNWQQIGVATGVLAQRFAITAERARTLAVNNADDEDTVALLLTWLLLIAALAIA
jgi:hypothetical protein